MLEKAGLQGTINGIKFSDQGPSMNHLLFADESLFLCKAEESEVSVLNGIIKVYGEATGQVINLNKLSTTFGAKVEEEVKATVKEIIGILNEGGACTYLGLPEYFSGSKIEMISFIQDRLKSRMSSWFGRMLSHGGKEILLNSVALAMYVYIMSCFKLHVATVTALTSAMSAFL